VHFHRRAHLPIIIASGILDSSVKVLDGVKQDVRSNDNHLGRSAGDDCRWLAV
jgi:hypothetical protein